MKRNHYNPIGWLVASSLLITSAAWSQSPVAITNAGFEDPVLADGALSPEGDVPGWNAFNSGKIQVLNPSSDNDLTAEAPEGENVGLVTSSANEDGLSQTLTSTFQEDADYALTVKVANTKFTTGFPGYRVQLLAGGTVLAEDDNSKTVAEDAVETAEIEYFYDAGDAGLVGQPLEIRLLSKGLAASQEVAFDDVQLTVTLLNPVADAGGPYTVPIAGSLTLDGSGSLPSDGESITTWEWDLDNDDTYDLTENSATAPPISYADLQTTYGMNVGANTIKLRVKDSASKISEPVEGIVTLAAPIGCQLGVLDLTANGGINPNTGNPWELGDKYRIAFHTSETTTATSNDPNFYNDFATAQAWQVEALRGAYWRAMVTVNMNGNLTQADSPKSHVRDNTGTNDGAGGAGVGGAGGPVYVMNGSTCIARNNADIWNSWSNPFAGNAVIRLASGSTNLNSDGNSVTASQNVHYSPFLNQFGLGDSANVHGWDIWSGTSNTGGHVNALGLTTDTTTGNIGASNANNTGRIWNRFTRGLTDAYRLYAISVPLTIVDLSETVAPTLVSFEDDREGADAILGVDSVVYTVTFSEPMNAGIITTDDFENAGDASVTIDSVRGTLNPAAFEVTVTPISTGILQLQIKALAEIEDPVGNPLNTSSPITDTTEINVVQDTTPPLLVSIEDNVAGGPVVAFNPIAYTVTFDKAIDAATIDTDDFGNGGTAPITVNSVSPTANPAVFTVVVTPTGAGDLTLEIVEGATITDTAGNPLNTDSALPDDTTITVTPDPLPALLSIVDNQAGGPVFETQSFTYFVTFDQVIDASTVDVTDFENGGSPALTVNAVARTSNPSVFAVHVTPGGTGTINLQIATTAVITNVNGTALDPATALPDDTTITVNAGSGPARGTITVDGVAFWSANAATLNGTLNASGSDKLVVIVTGEHGFSGDHSGTSTAVTYDGAPLTKVVERNPIPGTPQDQTFNDIWILDNPGAVHTAGAISATVITRGNVTAFALSGTAPGVGQTAISPQASKSVVLSTGFANSIVIASHGMGGDGNTANVGAVSTVSPLIQASATAQVSGSPSPWDGHVTAYALIASPGTATYAFTGGNLVGSHTIAAEFLAADLSVGTPFDLWAAGFTGLTDADPTLDFDGGGLATGIEWVLGGDPTDSSDDATIAPTFDNSDPDNFVFTFNRRDDAENDPNTTIVVEYVSDLIGWAPATDGVDGVTIDDTAVPQAGFRTVVVTIPKALAAGNKLFARLSVEVATP